MIVHAVWQVVHVSTAEWPANGKAAILSKCVAREEEVRM
jgi:hypothetical protein